MAGSQLQQLWDFEAIHTRAMVCSFRNKDKEHVESSTVEEKAPNEPPNQEQTNNEDGVIDANNMDHDLEQ